MKLLDVERLSKTFGGIAAIADVSFDVESGHILGVIGPNGAGKTTLFNCITGLESPTRGRVRFRGLDLLGMPAHQVVEKGIARTFQTTRLFGNLSVLENVMVARHIHSRSNIFCDLFRWPRAIREEAACRDHALKYLELFQLHQCAHKRADRLTLSQARHLELARALATEPKMLLLDEPCAGMDERERRELCRLLPEIQRLGVTLMIIEHDMEVVVNLCTEILVLNFGNLIARGDAEHVQRNEEVLAAYLGDELA